MNEDDLLKGVLGGTIQMWPLDDAFVFTSVEKHEQVTKLCVLLAGGDWSQIEEMLPRLKDYAKAKDYASIVSYARLGFYRKKIPQKLGFVPKRVFFELEI